MSEANRSIGVMTSGGDAPGMNAAVRAVVRTGLDRGVAVFAVHEGYEGVVEGGDLIQPATWDAVGGILGRGGTVIGTARNEAFRTPEGRRRGVKNLVVRGIDALVVIGGDGSLTGADTLRREWSDHLAALVASGEISEDLSRRHRQLTIVGIVGSIDNDMQGTDTTIGADSALHRIQEAVDAIGSTAASHQRTFVVEVMGRHCGYLALMSSLATAADYVLLPESPPVGDDWEREMCEQLAAGRKAGRRASIVIVSEGAVDRRGKRIETAQVKRALEERLRLEVRETILGHVQRGGTPSAFDRNMATFFGYEAVRTALDPEARGKALMIGVGEQRIVRRPLVACVEETHAVADALAARDFDRVLALRGDGFRSSLAIQRTLARARPREPREARRLRIAVMHSGAPAPGMNMAVRVAVRLGMDRGHEMLGVRGGFPGLAAGTLETLDWMSVNGWANRGGAELGTNSRVPRTRVLGRIARAIEDARVDALLVVGGLAGYEAVYRMWSHREKLRAFAMPIACLPASIDNNLPGSELSVGADTALNSIANAVDAIKQSAVASKRAFVVEVMGGECGYLALMSGFATGAERVYLPEEGVTLKDLARDVRRLVAGFELGKRVGLLIRNETTSAAYDTAFMVRLFEEEGGDLFDVRRAVLGHLQQGGSPSPFDRIQATRLAARCVDRLDEAHRAERPEAVFIGQEGGALRFHDFEGYRRRVDEDHRRPREQWWLALRPIARILAQPAPRRA